MKKRLISLLCALSLALLCGCGSASGVRGAEAGPDWSGMEPLSTLPLSYATEFSIDNYEEGRKLISITDGERYLVVPQGVSVPSGLDEDITVLQQPLSNIYLVATSAMDLFRALDAVDCIRLSGLKQSDWYITEAAEAMERGEMLYAGKYSAPDYERICQEKCSVAIESTMIYHTPKVKEMIEDLGIPVLVDRSSYESYPLGRTEWIKLYAALVGKEAEAAAFFDQQADIIRQLEDFENTGKTVAFFYVNSDGSIVIRKPTDYIPKMIALAGGKYAFENLITDQTATSISITMENFYATAVDADVLIYNASIDAPISSIDELLAKDALFADFKAVKEGNVWCTGKSFYQATDIVGEMIRDIHHVLTDGDESAMTFLTKVS